MGQYFKAVNTDKKEFVCPWCLGGGAKLWEWSANSQGAIFTLLLRKSNCTGGGDYGGQAPQVVELTKDQNIADAIAKGVAREGMLMPIPNESIVGRWAGDRVALVGDYDESGLYVEASEQYRNISEPLVEAWNQFIEIDTMKLRYDPCRGCVEQDGNLKITRDSRNCLSSFLDAGHRTGIGRMPPRCHVAFLMQTPIDYGSPMSRSPERLASKAFTLSRSRVSDRQIPIAPLLHFGEFER